MFFLVTIVDAYSQSSIPTSEGFESSRESRAQADLKFTYVVSCQIYGQQKQKKAPEATDIALLLQRLGDLKLIELLLSFAHTSILFY